MAKSGFSLPMSIKKTVVLCVLSGILNAQTPDFEVKGILYFQDGDFNTSSNFTKKITRNGLDWVGVFTFPLSYSSSQKPSEQSISNSISTNHRFVAVRNDKKNTYILESKGAIPKTEKEIAVASLPNGGFVSVLNTGNLSGVRPEYRFPVADNPTAISLDPSNKYLAVSSSMPGNEIQIFELDDFGKPLRMLPGISHFEGSAVNDILWHPSKDFLVYIKKEDKELGLIKIVRDKAAIIRMEQFGDIIKFEGSPTSAIFSKDEKNIFVLDSGQGERGSVFHIRLNFEEEGKHALLSRAFVEENPQHINMHPGGEYLLVTNAKKSDMESSYGKSSVSVLHFKNENLESKLNFPLDGILPSQVKFDRSGRNMALSYFQSKSFGKPMGQIEFFKFSSGTSPKIESQNVSVNVPVGVHYIEVFN